MSRRDSKGLNYPDREVLIPTNKQNDDLDVGAGDQVVTEDVTPLTHSMTTRLEWN